METTNINRLISNPTNIIQNNNIDQGLDNTNTENLGKDEFLKLLTVQLSHQDPLKPMSNTEFISQMAEFSALEQMKNMNLTVEILRTEFSKLANMNLIGKKVAFHNENGEYKTGTVEKISLNKNANATINGKQVAVEKIISIDGNNQMNQKKAQSYENNLKTKFIEKIKN